MAFYDGPPISRRSTRLVAPGQAFIDALASAELAPSEAAWAEIASHDERVLLFAVESEGRVVGQCFLHDIDQGKREAMLGYHIFLAADRGRGLGGAAVRELVAYAREELSLHWLIAITGVENIASQKTAMGAGLVRLGAAREGPHLVVFAANFE